MRSQNERNIINIDVSKPVLFDTNINMIPGAKGLLTPTSLTYKF